jgi:hypothetical protein
VYWKDIHAEAWRRTRESGFLEWKRLCTSVGIPVVSGLIQWRSGVSVPINIAVNLGTGLLLYALFIFVERYVRIRQAIEGRDARQLKAISDLNNRIEELTEPLVRVIFGQMTFGQWGAKSDSVIILNLTISNNDRPTTLGEWEICSEDGNTLRSPFIGFDEMRGQQRYRFDVGHALEGFFQFSGTGDDSQQWYFCFTDHRDHEYRLPIPRHLYRRT